MMSFIQSGNAIPLIKKWEYANPLFYRSLEPSLEPWRGKSETVIYGKAERYGSHSLLSFGNEKIYLIQSGNAIINHLLPMVIILLIIFLVISINY